ncbi:hypothetical protein NZK35_12515 [Stieleria sp. ICT_E10.1]|uniref:hypothetical protein n=1 Tax=Stieleria sedimenti TaxID=2976331 RepID=UPI00217F9B92|nr:hypothetical protein [Stieleria sedimenti]MCS7467470.1 hypothetical protein [Stieleria sedimenti]
MAKITACFALVAPASAVFAADPVQSDLPSYLAETPLTFAALVQGDGQAGAAVDAATDTAVTLVQNDDVPGTKDTTVPVAEEANRSLFSDRQTQLSDGKLVLPPIAALTTDTAEIGNGEVPLGFRQGATIPLIPLPESGIDRGLPWQWTARHWAAPNTFSHPLYFEDRMLERHGHQRYPRLQPFVSGGRFLAQAVSLPYLTAITPPSECQYSLGYYRAGACAPALKQRPPYQRKAVVSQATAVGVAAAILP